MRGSSGRPLSTGYHSLCSRISSFSSSKRQRRAIACQRCANRSRSSPHSSRSALVGARAAGGGERGSRPRCRAAAACSAAGRRRPGSSRPSAWSGARGARAAYPRQHLRIASPVHARRRTIPSSRFHSGARGRRAHRARPMRPRATSPSPRSTAPGSRRTSCPAPGGGPRADRAVRPGLGQRRHDQRGPADERGRRHRSAIAALRSAGYNVLTWDPRGFGGSGGEAKWDSPQYEARDVQALLDALAGFPEAKLDEPGRPARRHGRRELRRRHPVGDRRDRRPRGRDHARGLVALARHRASTRAASSRPAGAACCADWAASRASRPASSTPTACRRARWTRTCTRSARAGSLTGRLVDERPRLARVDRGPGRDVGRSRAHADARARAGRSTRCSRSTRRSRTSACCGRTTCRPG